MNIYKAFKQLKLGKRIRNTNWSNKSYSISLEDIEGFITLSKSDIMSSNWVIVEGENNEDIK